MANTLLCLCTLRDDLRCCSWPWRSCVVRGVAACRVGSPPFRGSDQPRSRAPGAEYADTDDIDMAFMLVSEDVVHPIEMHLGPRRPTVASCHVLP